jgi:hypothetical protein
MGWSAVQNTLGSGAFYLDLGDTISPAFGPPDVLTASKQHNGGEGSFINLIKYRYNSQTPSFTSFEAIQKSSEASNNPTFTDLTINGNPAFDMQEINANSSDSHYYIAKGSDVIGIDFLYKSSASPGEPGYDYSQYLPQFTALVKSVVIN